METYGFCLHCLSNRQFSLIAKPKQITVSDASFSYAELHAYCDECGSEMDVQWINEENATARRKAFEAAKSGGDTL